MQHKLPLIPETPSQTAGPYVHIGLTPVVAGNPERSQEISSVLAKPEAKGELITLKGKVYDGRGDLVKDAVIEVWQANEEGIYILTYDPSNTFNSFGRCAVNFDTGEWMIKTIKPGSLENKAGQRMAPHISLALFARGVNIHLQTRIYFSDEKDANQTCPVFNRIESKQRRDTLLAKRLDKAGEVLYVFDISMQGDQETVFFDF